MNRSAAPNSNNSASASTRAIRPLWPSSARNATNYLAFLKYPDALRRSLSTTNAVEAINGQLEIIRRNSGGYFQSEDTVKLKLGITITNLENGRGSKAPGG